MRTALDLLHLVLGVSSVDQITRLESSTATCFECFQIVLPIPEFRGVPPNWKVLILKAEIVRNKAWPPERIIAEANALVAGFAGQHPVLTISDATTVLLGDQFGRNPGNVFSVDAPNLPNKRDPQADARFSPFVLALQRKGLASVFELENFTPYIRGKPARGWQFFGRAKELHTLIHSDENYMIIGSRRVGKTSLMQEVEHTLAKKGEAVHYINVQHRTRANEVAREVLRVLSPKAATRAIRVGDALGERPLAVVLKKFAHSGRRTTLLIDELGNLILNRPKDDWNFIGLLRNYAQVGNLRVIISCFQEVLIKQQEEPEGPLVNFANTLRLKVFSESDVEDSFLTPFEFWLNLQPSERKELRSLVSSAVGTHPYFLQYFCSQLFERMSKANGGTLMENAKTIVRSDIVECFESPLEEVFYHRGGSALVNYVFLSRCKEIDDMGKTNLSSTIIDDDWLEGFLRREGFASTLASRRNVLEGLEVRGFASPVEGARSRQKIATPIVYWYVKQVEQPIESYLQKLKDDIQAEAPSWGLTVEGFKGPPNAH